MMSYKKIKLSKYADGSPAPTLILSSFSFEYEPHATMDFKKLG